MLSKKINTLEPHIRFIIRVLGSIVFKKNSAIIHTWSTSSRRPCFISSNEMYCSVTEQYFSVSSHRPGELVVEHCGSLNSWDFPSSRLNRLNTRILPKVLDSTDLSHIAQQSVDTNSCYQNIMNVLSIGIPLNDYFVHCTLVNVRHTYWAPLNQSQRRCIQLSWLYWCNYLQQLDLLHHNSSIKDHLCIYKIFTH